MKMICTETTYGEYSANIIFDIIKADNYLTIRTGGGPNQNNYLK